MGDVTRCPQCHSTNITATTVKTKSGNKVGAALGVTAVLGAAVLTATAAPVIAPVVAVLGAKGVERLIHLGGHRAIELGKDEYRTIYTCNNCGHRF